MDTIAAQLSTAMLHALWELVTFPAWWYTRGLARVGRWASRTLRGWEQAVGLRLWFTALFVPMYGQHDLQGRLVSFFMRLVVLVGRLVQVVAGVIAVVVVFIAYLVLPILATVQIVWVLVR